MSKNSQQSRPVASDVEIAEVQDTLASVVATLRGYSPDQIAEVKRQLSPSSGPTLLPGAKKADTTTHRNVKCVACNRGIVQPVYHPDDKHKDKDAKRIVDYVGSQYWEPETGLYLSVDCHKLYQEAKRSGLAAIECAKRPGTYLFPDTSADEFNALSTDDKARTLNKYYKMRMKRTMDRKNVSF
jgi:hypothetical protein